MSDILYKDIEVGPAAVVYKVPKGTNVPKKGEVIPTRAGDVIVVESSSDNGLIKVMLLHPKPMHVRLAEHKVEVEAAMEEIAETIYNRTATGLISKLGWILLPEEDKAEYFSLAYDIVTHLDVKNLLILPYE